MDGTCCVCLLPFSQLKGKKKQKKLYGVCCNDEMPKLSDLVTKAGGKSIFDTFSLDAVICYGCHQSLRKVVSKEKELRLLEEVINSLKKLPQVQTPVQTAARPNKRANNPPDNPRPSKATRINEPNSKTSDASCTYVSESYCA